MKHFAFTTFVLLGLIVSCAPTATPRPQVALSTTTTPIPTDTATATVMPMVPRDSGGSREKAMAATVLLEVPNDADASSVSIGSGSIIRSDGLILTNFHVIGNNSSQAFYSQQRTAYVSLVVLPNGVLGKRYMAQPEVWDTQTDLAVLRIVAEIDGTPIRGVLNLPTVELGDSDLIRSGDTVFIHGFPGLGGIYSLTTTKGIIAGFEVERTQTGEDRAWIKTDAQISRGNSGGLAVDENGRLMGIPTAVTFDPTLPSTLGYIRPIKLVFPLLRSVGSQTRPLTQQPNVMGGTSTPPAPKGQIAFSSKDGIFTINADGSNPRRLVANTDATQDWNKFPKWSPDGRFISFEASRGGDSGLYAINIDGTNERRLMGGPGIYGSFAWSPDGRSIAYDEVVQLFSDVRIYVMNADGANQRRLTNVSEENDSPKWSPDGRVIAYVFKSKSNGNPEIHLMNPDGTNQRTLTNIPKGSWGPAWSPDGRSIAFTSGSQIGVINTDGSNLHNVTNDPTMLIIASPIWSPDGRYIAFSSNGRNPGIYVVQADGMNQRLLSNDFNSAGLSWSPNSKFLVFSSSGENAIKVIDIDGTYMRRLAQGFDPVWSPR